MTLDEAKEQRLELTFLLSASEAEEHSKTLTDCGREVVATIIETLPEAARESYIVAVKPAVRVKGPQGFDNRRGK